MQSDKSIREDIAYNLVWISREISLKKIQKGMLRHSMMPPHKSDLVDKDCTHLCVVTPILAAKFRLGKESGSLCLKGSKNQEGSSYRMITGIDKVCQNIFQMGI